MAIKFLPIIFLSFILLSCQSEEVPERELPVEQQRPEPRRISTDVISNPRSASENKPVDQWAEMRFDRYDHDFGEITEGTKVETTFTFTNSGNANLIIFSAKGTCGCTVPDYPREPIAPGESGEIKVTFDSANRPGLQRKSVNITANTNPNVITLNLVSQVTQN